MKAKPPKGKPGGSEPTPGATADDLPERWSVQRKMELVLRLLRGEALDAVSRESQVPAHSPRTSSKKGASRTSGRGAEDEAGAQSRHGAPLSLDHDLSDLSACPLVGLCDPPRVGAGADGGAGAPDPGEGRGAPRGDPRGAGRVALSWRRLSERAPPARPLP